MRSDFAWRMSPLALLVVLLGACSASAAKKNRTVDPKTFVYHDPSATDEPFDMDSVIGLDSREDGIRRVNRSTSARPPNGTYVRKGLSEEALLFLTGPVSTVLIPSFYTLVCCVSVPINICAVLAFARGIRPKKAAAIYMLNLAFADLLFAALLPFKIAYHFEGNDWRFGALMCSVVTGAFYWNMYCSVLLIAAISLDRLLAVVYPIDSLGWRTPRNAVIVCAAMWALSLAGSVPLVVSDQTFQLRELNITTCHDVQSSGNVAWLKTYFTTLCCVLFFLPLVVTVTSYSRVIWTLSSVPHGVPKSSRRRTRAMVMTFTVLVIFVLCFMPTNCVLLAHYLQFYNEKSQEDPDGSYALYLVFLCVGSLNCLLDPLVYYFGSSQCQRQLANMLTCRKITERGSITSSSSDSCRSSSRTILKSGRTDTSKLNSSVTKLDSYQEHLSSQYKKLLV